MTWILSKNGKYLYAKHNSTIRADLNGNVYGGGFFSNLFGKGKTEPPQIVVPTAQELLQQSAAFQQQQFPQFAQARETGLAALQAQGFAPQLDIPVVDWGQFGATPFEQELATTQFQPLIEQARRQALQIGSLSGIPSAAPAHFGRAIAPAMQNIGQFLAQQQQQRGLTEQQRLMQQVLSSEQARQFQLSQAIGQDPWQEIFGGAQLGQEQAARQSAAEQLAFQQREAMKGGGSELLALLGGGLGFAVGGPVGAGIGAAAGGTLGSAFGGGAAPVGFQDVLLMSALGMGGGGAGAGITGGVGGTTQMIPGIGQTWSPSAAQFGATVPIGGF